MSLNTEKAVSRITYNGIPFELVIRGKNVVVPLSSAFAAATQIYYFQVNDDVVLFSGGNDNVGVWAYSVKNATFTQLYESGKHWCNFKMINNDCLISAKNTNSDNNDKGILLYDADKGTISRINETSWAYDTFQQVGNDYLIGGGNSIGLLLYETETKTIRELSSKGTWVNFYPLGNDCLISATSSAAVGLWRYYSTIKKLSLIYDDGYYWGSFIQIGNDVLISARLNTQNAKGLLLYSLDADTITKIFDEGYSYPYYQIIGGKCLIGSVTAAGVFSYDIKTKTVTRLYASGSNWHSFQQVGNDCLIGGASASNSGVLLYDGATETVTQIWTSGSPWSSFQVIGKDCLIACSTSATKGVLLYDGATRAITQINTEATWVTFYQICGEDCLFGCDTTSGSYSSSLWLYDGATKTVTKAYNGGGRWKYRQIVGNDCLLANYGASGAGIVLCNSETKTATQIFGKGNDYDTFKFDEKGNVYVSASDKTKSVYTVYYDAATKTAGLAGYYVELD